MTDAESPAQGTPEPLRALLARLAEAEHASAEKTRFIRNVSHEFRTPLSSIIGFAALLEREGEAMDAKLRAEYLDIVLRNARHLLHVVNDLLNISKVEAGTLEVTLLPLRAAEVAAAVIMALGPQAEERGVRIRLRDDGARPALADSGRLRQVLFNLLENAIKYSPPGADIVVRTRETGDEVRVEVVDQGPGIDSEDQERLFKEFSRVNPPGMRVVGAGLGLALSRMLTDAMGGRIGVDSTPGEGSTFWVALPVAHAPVGAAPAPAPPCAGAARRRTETVALVDDDADIRAFADAVLRHAGYRAVTDDGAPGVGERLREQRPALVLLDLNLARRTGVEALAELRAVPELDAAGVLAFTAGGMSEPDPPGFDGRVTKPVEPDALVAAVDEALEARPASVPPREPPAEGDFLAPLRARFRAGLAGRLRDIHAAAAGGGDRETLLRELHKLRGAAAGYGFDALSEAAANAEEALRRGADPADALGRVLHLLRAAACSP